MIFRHAAATPMMLSPLIDCRRARAFFR